VTFFHLTGVALAVLVTASSAAAQPALPLTASQGDTQFLVFLRSQPVGREEILVVRLADSLVVRGTSRLGAPIDITTRHAEVIYDLQWRPKSLIVDGVIRGQDVTLKTTFDGAKASNVIAVQGAPQSKADPVSADPVVLPNGFLGSYAALGLRLRGMKPGGELRAYLAPNGEVAVKIDAVTQERMETPKGGFAATRYALTFSSPPPAGDLPLSIWTNADGHLLRLSIPSQTLEMAREDIASAASRTSAFTIPGDQSIQIPAAGFNIAGTLTRPPNATGKLPLVILVSGSGPADRDETVAGIPVFGQIARDLVAAGFMALRYDRRGIGQSGGRAESVTLADYSEDVRSILYWAGRQKEIDKERIAVIGFGEGGGVAMLAAGRERDRISALVLAGAIATTGAELVIEQQKRLLSKMPIDDGQRAEKLALQEKINQAVIKGTGWTDIPEPVRRVADTPWFYSFLTFDPARAMRDVRQPILIVHGELDTQVPPHHADKLADMARARKNKAAVEVMKVPGLNHLLVPAKTGEVAEYAALGPDARVSAATTSAIAAWLTKTLPPKAP
jgi:fermentation-respiration switch protein FrsA (DUF1100 family)